MAWIESHQTLREHPKTAKAAKLLGVSIAETVGYLMFTWWWALDYAQDGDLTDYEEDIEIAIGWQGDPGAFVEALANCGFGKGAGFLERVDGKLTIHDWHDYAGKLVERRKMDAKRKRAAREAAREDIPQPSAGHPQDGVQSAYVENRTGPNPTEQDQKTTPTTTSKNGLTPASRVFFETWGRKRWKNKAQRRLFEETEALVGVDVMIRAVNWAAQNEIAKVPSICTTAKKMHRDGGASGKGSGKSPQVFR
jgi:hypothetical protein